MPIPALDGTVECNKFLGFNLLYIDGKNSDIVSNRSCTLFVFIVTMHRFMYQYYVFHVHEVVVSLLLL